MAEHKTYEQSYGGTKPLAEAVIGEELGYLDFEVSEEQVERNAWANDDYHPWYMDESPFGGRIASPVFLASFDARVFYAYYAYPADGSLFAKQEFEYVKPIFVGVPYRISGRLVEIYQRKGRTFYRTLMTVTDRRDGTETMRMVKTVATPVKVPAEAAA